MALQDVGAKLVVQGEGKFVSGMTKAEQAMIRAGNAATRLQAQTINAQAALTRAQVSQDKANAGLENSTLSLRESLVLGAAAVGAIAAPLFIAEKAAREFESSFTGVRKTVDGTEPEMRALERAFRDMALTIPINVNELNRIGEAAGQLGVKKENIQEFTKVIAEMGIATNLTTEQAAESMARFANIMQLPQEQFRNLGSAVVDLGNNSAATESDILNMALRLAGAGNVIGLTTPQILGMATALSSVGIEAESGGTAFSRVFVDIANSVKTGGEKLDLFAAVAGKTTADFKRQFETDAAGAITSFVTGLNRVRTSGANVFEVLETLELGEIRVRDALLRASGAGTLFTDSMDRGSKSYAENAALGNEANKVYQTTESKLTLAKNAAHEAAITLGKELQPAEVDVTVALTAFLNDALIPLVQTHGPGLGRFLSASITGWTELAKSIRNDTVPAMDLLILAVKTLAMLNPVVLISEVGAAALKANAARGAPDIDAAARRFAESQRSPAMVFDVGAGIATAELAQLTKELGALSAAAHGAEEPIDQLALTIHEVAEETKKSDPELDELRRRIAALLAAAGGATPKVKELSTAMKTLGVDASTLREAMALLNLSADEQERVLQAVGVSALEAGAIIPGLTVTVAQLAGVFNAAGLEGQVLAERIMAIATASVATARDEAAASKAAADAAREHAEAIRKVQEAREAALAGILAIAGRDIGGVALGRDDPLANLALGADILADLTKAGADLTIPLTLIDQALSALSGRLATLGGADLAEAGAVMDGLRRLYDALRNGEIGTEEFTAGLGRLMGRLSDLAGKVDTMEEEWAAKSKALWEEVAQTRAEIFNASTELYLHNLRAETEASQKAWAERLRVQRQAVDAMVQQNMRLEDQGNAALRRRDNERLEEFVRTAAGGQFGAGFDLEALLSRGNTIMQIAEALSPLMQIGNVKLGDLIARLGGTVAAPSLPAGFSGGQQATGLVSLPPGSAAAPASTTTSYNVTANYTTPQEPQSLRYDLEALVLLAGR